MNQQYIRVPVTRRGKIKLRKVQNIGLVKGVKTFLLDQQYAFQCAPMGDTEESMTVIRMTIPKGTPVLQGYREICNSLEAMGYDCIKVCTAMGFDEIIEACASNVVVDCLRGYSVDTVIIDDPLCPVIDGCSP